MSKKNLLVCGVAFPATIMNRHFACCTLPPRHRGNHRCMVDYDWPSHDIILSSNDPVQQAKIDKNPPRLMSFRIRAPKGKEQHPFIHAAIESSEPTP